MPLQRRPMQQALERLRTLTPGVEIAALLTAEGRIVASSTERPDADLTVLCGMVTALHNLGDRALAELGLGELGGLLLRGSLGVLAAIPVDDDAYAVALTTDRVAAGAVLSDLRHVAAQARERSAA